MKKFMTFEDKSEKYKMNKRRVLEENLEYVNIATQTFFDIICNTDKYTIK